MRATSCTALALLLAIGLLAEPGLAQRADGDPTFAPGSEPGLRRVIVELAVASRTEARRDRRDRRSKRRPTPRERRQRRAAIAAMQGRLDGVLRGRRARELRRFRNVPFLAVEADEDAIDALRASPMVRSVAPDRLFRPTLAESTSLIGADLTAAAGASGFPLAVAVLDTGVDPDHPALAGRIIDEACFSANGDCPGGGVEEFGPGSARHCAEVSCFHGTHVAGIATSADGFYPGVAPAALLVPIQVFSTFSGPICAGADPCVLSYESDQIAALEYVLDLAETETRHIAAVNLSLGGSAYTSQAACDAANAAMKAAIDSLRDAEIATIVSSGNDGFLDRLSEPACISSAISVGATTKNDGIPAYSNSASFLSLLAPGSSITSIIPLSLGSPYGTASGTSMAAPQVAGAFVALRSADFGAGVDEILAALQSTGVAITDVNGVTVSRIAVDEAMALLQAPDCGDGIDNDADGLADFPDDPGCASASADVEDPACNDGLDNDGDGAVDLADPTCVSASTGRERRGACGLGFEVAPLLLLLGRLRRRRRPALQSASRGSRSIP